MGDGAAMPAATARGVAISPGPTLAQAALPSAVTVVQPSPPAGPLILRQGVLMPPALGLKYGEDSKYLGFFPAQVWNYMQENGANLATEAAQVRCVTMALGGTAVECMVSLHNNEAPEIQSFDRFMMALCKQFKDPLAQRKVRTCIKTINQGHRRVAVYPSRVL